MTATPDPVLFPYLLGELSTEEEAALDERAFVDDAWHEETAAAADDLIDAYLADRLPADRRQRFETRFLAAPQHRERYRLLRDLRTVTRAAPARIESQSRGRAVLWIGLAAGAVLVLAWPALSRRPVVDDRVAHVPTPTLARTPTPDAVQAASPSVPPVPAIATVDLPGRPRTTTVTLAPGVRRVRFTIPRTEAARYVARIVREERTLWEEVDLEPSANEPIVVEVPAEVLRGNGSSMVVEADLTRGEPPPPGPARRSWSLVVVTAGAPQKFR